MTLEDKLRNALRETAGEIPDDPPPPLRLSPLAVSRQPARRRPAKPHGPRWPSWAAPLAAAVTPEKCTYGRGTAIRASTAPVAVALTSAAVALPFAGSGWVPGTVSAT